MPHYADLIIDVFIFSVMEMIRPVAFGIEHNRID